MRSHRCPARLALALSLALAAPARAADRDAPDEAQSVYAVSLPVDGAISAAAGLAALVPYLLQDRIIRVRCPCDRSEVPRFERFVIGYRSQAADVGSDTLAALSVAVPAGADVLLLGGGRPLLEDAVVFTQTLLVNGAIVTTVKDAVQRPTPRAYAGDAPIVSKPTGYRSFYSGHTSTAVAALTAAAWTARLRYGAGAWIWAVVGGVGASVGALRIAGGNHFPTDVATGALAGFAVGTAVPLLHRRGRRSILLAPTRDGVTLAGEF